jgi:DNA-binding GntR family transcriptional regulator
MASQAQANNPVPHTISPVHRSAARERISDRVYDELVSAIREMRLEPGALLSETELSTQLGVSRTPVRDAISRLVDIRLLEVVPQVGTSVALIELAAVEEACFIRSALESAAFEKACSDPQRDVSTLRAIVARQDKALSEEDGNAFFQSDESLHQEIFRLSGYAGAWNVVLRSKLQLDRLRRLILPEVLTTRSLVEEHSHLVDLLEQGDIDGGRALIHTHSRHVLLQAPQIRAEHPHFFAS